MDVHLKWLVSDNNDYSLPVLIISGVICLLVVCGMIFIIARCFCCPYQTEAERARRDRNRNRDENDENNPANIRMIEHRRYVYSQQDPNMWARPVAVAAGDAVT